MKIELVIRGIGHVPSFKNSKMLTRGKLITDPKKQKWMNQAIRVIASQLKYGSVITDAGTLMAQHQPCSTVSFPLDDSWQWIPELHVKAVRCAKGSEGARITIERIC